jgi:hypothetical protein
MIKIIFVALIFTGQLICQESKIEYQNIKPFQNDFIDDSIHTKNPTNNELFIPLESFKVFTDPLFIPLSNFDIKENLSNSDTFIPLGFTSDAEYLVYLNKSELLQSLNKKYQLSKPGTFQQILGMLQVSAAAALAGYHIYKYEIKKEKK